MARAKEGVSQRWGAMWALAAFLCISLGGWLRRAEPAAILEQGLIGLAAFYALGWGIGRLIENAGAVEPRRKEE